MCAKMAGCLAWRPSCTPTSTRSTPRSSSATTRALRGRPVIVGGGVVLAASYEAKALRGAHRDGRRARPGALCPRRDRGAAADGGVLGGQQGRLRRSSATPPRSSRASRSTRRSSRSAGCSGSRARPPTSPPGCAREVRERVGLPITVGVARTKFLAKVASAVGKPDGLLVVPPGRGAGVPAPAAGRAALGRRPGDRRQAARRGTSTPSGTSPGSARPRWWRCSARAPGGTCTPWRTTATRGRCRPGAAGGSMGAQCALGRARPHLPTRSTRSSPTLVDRVTRRMRAAGRAGPHGGAAAALRRLHPGDAVAHAAQGHRATPSRSSPPPGPCWPRPGR